VNVYLYPVDMFGCGHLRMHWPMEAVRELDEPGLQVVEVEPDARTVAIEFDQHGNVVRESFPARAGDVVVFQRPTSKFQPQAIDQLQARGVAVVIDLDDDLAHVHPRNVAHWQMRPKVPMVDPLTGRVVRKTNAHSWHFAAEACRHAALVTVTTDELARHYGAHGRVAVLPNMIPEWYLTVPHEDSAMIGWAGVVSTHPDDLQQVGPAVARLVAGGARFCTVGDQREVVRALGLAAAPDSTGPLTMEQYPYGVALFGVGIAPLADTRFNRAKSRLKPLEYAAVGVPWVGSPVPDYLALHAEGCGLIARRPRDWEGTLRRLIRDPGLRADLSAAGREVAARHTVERNARRWLDAWRAAVTNLERLPGAGDPRPGRPAWSLPPPAL
jgi:glycosyltransferase involved in cell wall biosynthesis